MSANALSLEQMLKRDRARVLAGLSAIAVLAWAYLVRLALEMQGMDMAMAMPRMKPWDAVELFLLFVMWTVMMVAMMVPSAAPMVLLFAAVNRQRKERQGPFVPTAVFLSGYLAVWAGFSLAATLAQWGLESAALLSPMMVSTSPLFGGTLLVLAGLYQWTSWKRACLIHCRSPLSFLMSDWRDGRWGAFRMGVRHGAYCLGCCWILMGILFVAGVMNLLWVALIAAFVLVEKLAPRGELAGRAGGALLVLAGLAVLGYR